MFGVPWNGDTISPPDVSVLILYLNPDDQPYVQMNRYFQLASEDLVVPNQDAWALLWDFTTLRELVDTLPGNTPLQNKALIVANEIMNVFHKGDPSDVRQARKLAEQVFGAGWEAKGSAIYEEGAKRAQIWGIGHCHIDTAW